MATSTEIQDVVQQNRARQNRARTLNLRAGEKVFPVLSQDEMRAWVNSRLGGARSIAEVKKPWELLLQSLDEAVVRKVETENPETMEVPGIGSFAVKYQEGRAPQVDIRENWQQIPDAGTCLPGGRKVAFYILAGGYGFGPSENVADLKNQVADNLAKQAFTGFSKPQFQVPDLYAEGAEVPAIREECYGTHALSGEKLLAYGALVHDSWYGRYQWNWYRTRNEAEVALQPLIQRMEQIAAEARRVREQVEAQRKAEAERLLAEAERQKKDEEALRQAEAARLKLAEEQKMREEKAKKKIQPTSSSLTGLFGGNVTVIKLKKQ